jgi:hypothetical protein
VVKRENANRQPFQLIFSRLNNEAFCDIKKFLTSNLCAVDLQPILFYLLFWRSYFVEPGGGLGVGISRCFSRLKP